MENSLLIMGHILKVSGSKINNMVLANSPTQMGKLSMGYGKMAIKFPSWIKNP